MYVVFLIPTVQVPYYCFVSGAEQQLCKSCKKKKEQYGSVFIAVLYCQYILQLNGLFTVNWLKSLCLTKSYIYRVNCTANTQVYCPGFRTHFPPPEDLFVHYTFLYIKRLFYDIIDLLRVFYMSLCAGLT